MLIYSDMSMGDRILFIRENCGDLSQDEFAKRLGMTKSAISGYETGRRIPTDSVLKHIAHEFRVDEEWLKNGSGEPFEPTDDDILDEMFDKFNCSEFERTFLRAYLFLPEKDRLEFSKYLERLFLGVADELGYTKKPQQTNSSTVAAPADKVDVIAELDEVKRQNQELLARMEAMEKEDEIAEEEPLPKINKKSGF